VRIYDGFDERATRLLFPYSDHFEQLSDGPKPEHMTILASGLVENPKKPLLLGGTWTRDEVESYSDEQIRTFLGKHDIEPPDDTSREELMEQLIGIYRDPNLRDRALITFTMPQTIAPATAAEHIAQAPSNHFVFLREDDTFAVVHCWPVKYNEGFKRSFACSEENPDETVFSPKAVFEFRQAMRRTFGPGARKVPVVYASKTTHNPHLVLVGMRKALTEFLKANKNVVQALGITEVTQDSFCAAVEAKGKLTGAMKWFTIAPQGESVVYVKTGFEKMACTKPFDLFQKECKLGQRLMSYSDVVSRIGDAGQSSHT